MVEDLTMPELILHVGLNKTGTSAIQHFFAHHRRKLMESGILYPSAGMRGTAHYDLTTALGFNRHGKAPDPEWIRALGDELYREVDAVRPRKVLVSSEMFVLPGEIEHVREFFEGFQVRVLVYLRRHDDWWISAYNQSVRAIKNPGWASGFRNYLSFQRRNPNRWYLGYRRFVDAWAEVFGRNVMIVRPYESSQNRPSLLHDFLATIGAPLVLVQGMKQASVNRSVPLQALQMIDLYQRTVADDDLRTSLIAWIEANMKGGIPFDLPLALKRQLVEENLADYDYIARNYLGRDDGRLFIEPVTSTTDESLEETRPMSVEGAMTITMNALQDILERRQQGNKANA